MTHPLRFLACLALGGVFALSVGKSLHSLVVLGCLGDPDLPFCGLAALGRLPLERQPLQSLPLVAWAIAAMAVAGVLMAVWLRSDRSRGGRPDGVTLCCLALATGALASAVSVACVRWVMRARGIGMADGVDLGALTPLLVIFVTVGVAVGLWRMQVWARFVTIALGLLLSAGLVWTARFMALRMPEAPLDPSLVLALVQWVAIAMYLLLPATGRHFSRRAVAPA